MARFVEALPDRGLEDRAEVGVGGVGKCLGSIEARGGPSLSRETLLVVQVHHGLLGGSG